jgi:hypothetical protein
MARTRNTKRQPPKEVEPPATSLTVPDEPVLMTAEPAREPEAAPAPVAPPPPPERRFGVAEYIATARLPPMQASILRVLHAATKATRAGWDAHLAHALSRPTR